MTRCKTCGLELAGKAAEAGFCLTHGSQEVFELAMADAYAAAVAALHDSGLHAEAETMRLMGIFDKGGLLP